MKQMIESAGEPLTVSEILGRMVDKGYREVPTRNEAANILRKSGGFVAVGFEQVKGLNSRYTTNLWDVKR